MPNEVLRSIANHPVGPVFRSGHQDAYGVRRGVAANKFVAGYAVPAAAQQMHAVGGQSVFGCQGINVKHAVGNLRQHHPHRTNTLARNSELRLVEYEGFGVPPTARVYPAQKSLKTAGKRVAWAIGGGSKRLAAPGLRTPGGIAAKQPRAGREVALLGKHATGDVHLVGAVHKEVGRGWGGKVVLRRPTKRVSCKARGLRFGESCICVSVRMEYHTTRAILKFRTYNGTSG